MQIRDRIKEFRRVRAADLRPHPRNWRIHPAGQRDALSAMLAEIGYASALIARELDDGSLELIDGHLRAETTPDALVPVLIVDLDDTEAAKLLVTFDPLSGMAETDFEALSALMVQFEIPSQSLLNTICTLRDHAEPLVLPSSEANQADKPIPELFQVVVECRDEDEQRAVFVCMTAEGYRCKLLTL